MSVRVILIFIFFLISGSAISQIDFKNQFNDATDFMHKGNYPKALKIWKKLESHHPDNTNIKFSIAMCYLNSRFDKELAIPYFISAESRMTDDYKIGNYKEEDSPLEAILYLGKTYHINYQFDEALEKYYEYKEILSKRNKKDQKRIEHELSMSDNAVVLVNNPVDITINGINREIAITENAKEMQNDSVKVTFNHLYNINTEFPEYRPIVNADETMMIFTARRDDSKGGRKDDQGMYYEDLYVSYNENGIWQKPESMGDKINTRGHEATVYLNPAGDRLFLYKDKGDEQGGGIYESVVYGDGWVVPDLMEGDINSPAWETHASLSANERSLAFTSDREGGKGGRDIWVLNKLPNGEWSEATSIGDSINTIWDEESPYLHPDGKTLYFSSKGHTSMGGFDVFYSTKDENGVWGKPKNMGYPVNTTGDDVFFMPTTNGRKAYFSSYRQEGKGHLDIYSMELDFLEEKSLTIYKGMAHDETGAVIKNLVITVYDEETDDIYGVYKPSPITGKFLFILHPGQTYEIEYEIDGIIQTEKIYVADGGGTEKVGRLIVSEKDKINISSAESSDLDILEIARLKGASNLEIIEVEVNLNMNEDKERVVEQKVRDEAAEKAQEEIKEVLNDGGTIVLNNVLFDFDKATLTNKAENTIDFVFNYLDENKETKIKVNGYTDSKGKEKYNLRLSDRRVKTVRSYLIKKGIDKSRIQFEGHGESDPVAPNKMENGDDSPEGRAKNRRVEFQLILQ